MGVKILFFSRGTLGQNSMFPEKGGQNSIFFPSALKKGGQNRGAYQPTSLKGCPPPPPGISLQFVPQVWINNIPALVQIIAWHRPGNTPLFEPMMVSLLTHISVTWPQWVKVLRNLTHSPLLHCYGIGWHQTFIKISLLWSGRGLQ